MEQVVIVDAIRTPMGRSKGGAFRHVRAEDLSAHLMRSLLSRNPSLDPARLTISTGAACSKPWSKVSTSPVTRAAGGDPAFGTGRHGQPPVRFVMQALHDAARMIMTGDASVCLIGGVEHMGHVPMSHGVDFRA
jgi:acetyl-CoA acyltransferase